MKILLDTHAFLWFDAAREKLSNTAAEVLSNPDHEIYLSAASVWEMQIKNATATTGTADTAPFIDSIATRDEQYSHPADRA